MTLEGARELAHLYFEEALNRGNLEVVDRIIADDFRLFVPPSLGDGAQVERPEGFRQTVLSLRAAFPDVSFEIHDVTRNDDTVMVSWTMTGTQTGDWHGIPPAGRRASLTGVDVFRMAGSKIVEERIHGDYLGFLRQLGAIPQ